MILPGLATGARRLISDNGTRAPVSDSCSTFARTSSKCSITQSDFGYGHVGLGTAAKASVTSTTSAPMATPILLSLKRQSFIGQVLQDDAAFSAARFAKQTQLLVHRAIRVTEDN